MPHSDRGPSKKRALLEIVSARGWSRIGEPEWRELLTLIPGLRSDHLQWAGIPADAPWGGVDQHSLDSLAASLIAFSAICTNQPDLRKFCRAEVIRAKDRARFIALSPAVALQKRELKGEMVEWMLVWLGDPGLFESWVGIRRSKLTDSAVTPST